ncbi:MAG: TGS domain-containing protein [Nitrososphaerales archaeon]
MPTNLTQEAKAKWAAAIAANDPATKLRLLKEFYSVMPKHKSTEKLEMSIKRQIASLQEDVERKQSREIGSSRLEWSVRKEEALQLALVGRLQQAVEVFNALTGLDVSVYNALKKPLVGTFRALNLRSQVVLTPLDETVGEEKRDKFVSVARNADVILVAVDEADYAKKVSGWFGESNIDITSSRPNVELEYTPHGGIRIVGRSENINERVAFEFLRSFNIRNAVVKLSRSTTMDDLEDAIFGRIAKRSVFLLLDDHLSLSMGNRIRFHAHEKERFLQDLLMRLSLLRIFTKRVGSKPVEEPLLFNDGSKVVDLARRIHRDFARRFKFARIWRSGSSFKVGKDFRLRDFDVVELHME